MKPRPETENPRRGRNNDCKKHAKHWHFFEASTTEMEVSELIAALCRAVQPNLVVETGSHVGRTIHLIGKALKANGHGRAIGLEPNKHFAYKSQSAIKGLPVKIIVSRSLDWVPDDNEVIDMAFFDSFLVSRLKEFYHFRPFLDRHSVVSWHDTGHQHRSNQRLRTMIDRLVSERQIEKIQLPTPRGITIARVLK